MKGVMIMKKIISLCLCNFLLFFLVGCNENNKEVKADIFNIKIASEVASDYMQKVTSGEFEEANKITTKSIKDNEDIKGIKKDNINGYKLDRVSEGADHAYFKYLIVREEKDESRVDLDSLVLKVEKVNDEYLVDEIKSKNEKQIYKVDKTLRSRDYEIGKSQLLLRMKDLPREVYPSKDNVVINKEGVPQGSFSKIGIGFNGNKVAFTTTDNLRTFIGLIVVEDSKATSGSANSSASVEKDIDRAIDDALEVPILNKLIPYDVVDGSKVEKLLFSKDDGELIVQIREEGKGSGIRIYKNPTGELLKLNLNEYFPVEKYSSDVMRIDDKGVFIKVTALTDDKKNEGTYKIDVEELKVFKE